MAERSSNQGTKNSSSGGRKSSTASRSTASRRTTTDANDFITESPGIMTSSERVSGQNLAQMLDRLGISPQILEAMADTWKSQLSNQVRNKIEETDVREALDKARELAGGSVDRVKDYSRKNPTLFFSGLAAILMGAGLLAAAGREEMDEDDGESVKGTTTGGSR